MKCTDEKCFIKDKKHICFYNAQGQLHREDGPAFISSNGTQYWYKNGIRHREDGPGVIFSDGRQYWYLKGEIII